MVESQQKISLDQLLGQEEFIQRHIGLSAGDQKKMLESLGLESIEALIKQVLPQSIDASDQPLNLSSAKGEQQALAELRTLAEKNKVMTSFIGQGYYNTITPPVIQRNILENPAWYTAYTPYQPEISQGRLEALFHYQTLVTELTGLDMANASLLDEATAAAEAMMLCRRMSKTKSNVFFVDKECLPQTIDVVLTRAHAVGIDVVLGDPETEIEGREFFGVLVQYPGANGNVRTFEQAVKTAHDQKALTIFAADILSLLLLKSPGDLGADVAVGSTQRFGVPMGCGGPHAAYMATKEKYKRSLPGRLVGLSLDSNGQPAYRLALQAREQHIRREKATSNICTAQVLLAVMATMYAVYHGPKGLKHIALRVHRLTQILAHGLNQLGIKVLNDNYFDTLTVQLPPEQVVAIHERSESYGFNLRHIDNSLIGISCDECTQPTDIESLFRLFSEVTSQSSMKLSVFDIDKQIEDNLNSELLRSDVVLTQDVFNRYHSETEMMRYLRQLADKDMALDRAMIPLGSCTMKLNATAEMMPVTWPEFSQIHPWAPISQRLGYATLVEELESMLAEVTGYDQVSIQPNAGSQGEYAGLLAIQAYHCSRGDEHRHICLVPSSAHGTNPASAQLCNMKVVVVKCDDNGNVDVDDLRDKAQKHAEDLSAIMITYPSTHGVFEERIVEVCDIVHEYGGQVYMDGANLNAMVGLCYPGQFGGDVSHLNLHKTFSIPHGGGGPGVGPIAVRSHLAPFLPKHRHFSVKSIDPLNGSEENSIGPVSAAPWGSAGILPISWMYLKLLGRQGARQATEIAILNANYMANRLKDAYPILYTGQAGRVAHECIVDLRPIKETAGVTVEDVAKRLMDYGFHAPTMSFPVAGTLMIEPTESESLEEVDRFCDAMLAIRKEILDIEDGKMSKDDNPLINAPHTATSLTKEWVHPYSRERAVYPDGNQNRNKYWPPVGRVDNVYGDRNLVCSCAPISAYENEG